MMQWFVHNNLLIVTNIPQKISITIKICRFLCVLKIPSVFICTRQGISLRTRRDNLDDPFVRDSNSIAILEGFANIDDTLKNHNENGPKMQIYAQQKFRMKSLLALQNLFDRKLKIL